jgi:hypothetical protein
MESLKSKMETEVRAMASHNRNQTRSHTSFDSISTPVVKQTGGSYVVALKNISCVVDCGI